MKRDRVQNRFLDELKKVPIVQVACERCGISRQSVYRWRLEDSEFRRRMMSALEEGDALVDDICESQLLSKVKDGHFPAIRYRLDRLHPKYRKQVSTTSQKEPINKYQHLSDDELIANLHEAKKAAAEKQEQEYPHNLIDTEDED